MFPAKLNPQLKFTTSYIVIINTYTVVCHTCRFLSYILDEIAQDEEHIHISLPLFSVYTVIANIGIIFAIICLVLNLWFREQKYVIFIFNYIAIISNYIFIILQISETWQSIC